MYANGRGVEQDDAEAVKWYRLAAEQGDADAQANLGTMAYHNGKGSRAELSGGVYLAFHCGGEWNQILGEKPG